MEESALCRSLNALAVETWVHMDYGFNRGYGLPDERAFTDHHLIELCRRHPTEIRAAKFNQNEEAKTAADFEWFIGDGVTYVRFRVQAKKLDLGRCAYPGLAARIGTSSERQLDRLIDAGLRDGFTPLYLFYNGPCRDLPPEDRCENHNLSAEVRGCTVALAGEVRRQLDDQGPGLAAIAPVSWPWQCLSCCPLTPDQHPGRRAIAVLAAGAGPQDEPLPQLTAQMPAYVQAVLETDPAELGFLADFRGDQLPGARTVLTMTAGGDWQQRPNDEQL